MTGRGPKKNRVSSWELASAVKRGVRMTEFIARVTLRVIELRITFIKNISNKDGLDVGNIGRNSEGDFVIRTQGKSERNASKRAVESKAKSDRRLTRERSDLRLQSIKKVN